jgi:polysaccharide export outer membrane protein
MCVFVPGCHTPRLPPPGGLPSELEKVTLPEYVIAPPDVLMINALRVVPRPPYKVQSLDVLAIQAIPALPEQPIAGYYNVEPEGNVNLGFNYGSVEVVDLTIPQVKQAIEKHLKTVLKGAFQVTVSLAQSRALLQIRGEHLVKQDGTIGLGTYGSVFVAGLTLQQARAAIEAQLGTFLSNPEVSVEVSGFNSHVYYVITDGGGYGEQVIRLPITGNETVLDAVGMINGLSPVSSRHRIWVARPTAAEQQCEQVLPVDWVGITRRGATATNYQLNAGDRVYIQAIPLVTVDTMMARVISPVERILGVTLLGGSTWQTVNNASTRTSSGTTGTQ